MSELDKENLKIEVYCPNCEKKVKVELLDLVIQWGSFGIEKKCEHCNHKIDIFYTQKGIMELINKG